MNESFRRGPRVFVLIFTALMLLTACNSNSNLDSPTVSTMDYRLETNGELVHIDSDAVNRAGYDAETRVMTVEFDNLSIYTYSDVPREIWTEFYDAQPNPWHEVGYPKIAYKFEYEVLFDPKS